MPTPEEQAREIIDQKLITADWVGQMEGVREPWQIKSNRKRKLMTKIKIPPEVKNQVDEIVANFNQTELKNQPYRWFSTRYRGQYLYLDSPKTYRTWPVCRLTYTGNMGGWEFAIYKYSNERFAPDEWFFPGAEHIDGTIEGAMQAGLEAYP